MEFLRTYINEHAHTAEDVLNLLENDYIVKLNLYNYYKKEYQKEDIMNEVEERDESITPEELEKIADTYQDNLDCSDEWNLILNATLDDFFDERGND